MMMKEIIRCLLSPGVRLNYEQVQGLLLVAQPHSSPCPACLQAHLRKSNV